MNIITQSQNINGNWQLSAFPIPLKALITAILITLAFGMIGAGGQIIIHDLIPTFLSNTEKGQGHQHGGNTTKSHHSGGRNNVSSHENTNNEDFFADMDKGNTKISDTPFYSTENFIGLLKWTHIHLFGMNFIFILLGSVTLLLNLSGKIRTWLIVLPFIGIFIDIGAMWLRSYVSDVFFWLHIPGGGLFVGIFVVVFLRAMWEMWIMQPPE